MTQAEKKRGNLDSTLRQDCKMSQISCVHPCKKSDQNRQFSYPNGGEGGGKFDFSIGYV